MRTSSASMLAIAALACVWAAYATDDPSVDQALGALAAMAGQQCPQLQQRLAQARQHEPPDVVSGVESGYSMLCVCLPAQVQRVRASLTPAELGAKLPESDLQRLYITRVVGKCGADQLRSVYADGCTERFATKRRNSEKYCKCMSRKLAKLSDSDAAALGLANADYTPLAAEATRKGLPPPEPAPVLKQFLAEERACSAP